MKDLLEFIIKSILPNNNFTILQEDSSDQIVFTVLTEAENLGKIIGKKGKIIGAIRRLLKVRASIEGKKVFLKVASFDQKEKGFSLSSEGEEGEKTKLAE